MNLDQFWNLVEKVHRASGGDMDTKCELRDAELRHPQNYEPGVSVDVQHDKHKT